MPQLSTDQLEIARKSHSQILSGLASVGQVNVARALELSESAVSKLKSEGDLERLSQLLSFLGLKVVPTKYRCEDPEYLAAMEMLAHRYMESRQHKARPTLDFGDLE